MPTGSPSPRPAATTRRAALGAALAGVVTLTACDAGRDDAGDDPGVSATPDPDTVVVADVVRELTALVSLAGSVAAAHAGLRSRADAFRDLHVAHLEALGEDVPPRGARDRVGDAAAARKTLLAREQRGQQRLVEASVSARSGTLARLLACMSAGTAQRLALESGTTNAVPR